MVIRLLRCWCLSSSVIWCYKRSNGQGLHSRLSVCGNCNGLAHLVLTASVKFNQQLAFASWSNRLFCPIRHGTSAATFCVYDHQRCISRILKFKKVLHVGP